MAKRRIETKASRTAAYTCFSRACATREKDSRIQGPDYLAEAILPTPARLLLDISPLRKLFMQRLFPLGIYTAEDGTRLGHVNGIHCIVVAEVRQAGGSHNAPTG